MTNDEKYIAYLKAASTQRTGSDWQKPQFVPKIVKILKTVTSDPPGEELTIDTGEYEVDYTKWGAVFVTTENGCLGLRPIEFDVIEWQENLK